MTTLPRAGNLPVSSRFPMQGTDELWSLDWTIAHFVLPRLRLFRKNAIGKTPWDVATNKKWLSILDKMIVAFDLAAKGGWDVSPGKVKKIREGMDLFAKHFLSLWN